MCRCCGSFGKGAEGHLIPCSQCGQCYHPYCVNVKVQSFYVSKFISSRRPVQIQIQPKGQGAPKCTTPISEFGVATAHPNDAFCVGIKISISIHSIQMEFLSRRVIWMRYSLIEYLLKQWYELSAHLAF